MAPDIYYDIGNVHRSGTTKAKKVKRWLDRGLSICYAFNYEKTLRYFEYSLEEDPSCPLPSKV